MKILQQNRKHLILKSPAKINLFLSITGKRPDGYHGLLTIMQKISLFDRLVVQKVDKGIRCEISIPDIPEKKNIAFLAAKVFFEKTGLQGGVHIDIEKFIPPGGGLGGGSSNAAGVLKALNLLYGRPLIPEELHDLGAKLGADVPFFLKRGTWVMGGRGDLFLQKIKGPALYYLLFHLNKKSDTKTVYSSLKKRSFYSVKPMNRLSHALRQGSFHFVKKKIANDLLLPFLESYPEQREIYIDLQKKMCHNLFLSGSGSTFFSVFDTKKHMRDTFMHLDHSIKKYVIQAKSF